MPAERKGDACAFIKGAPGQSNRYYKLGMAMQKSDGRISIKIDTMPLAALGWEGWINIFWKDPEGQPAVRPTVAAATYKPFGGKFGFDDFDDDVPF